MSESTKQLETVIEDLGLVDYRQALERQLSFVDEIQNNPQKQIIIFCSHPAIATLGRKTKPEDLYGWSGDQIEVQRGGRVTYHGPNQLVVYPIVNLQQERKNLKARDLHGYLRALENAAIDVLKNYDVKASSKPSSDFLKKFDDVEASGIWIGDRKLGSIGIGVKKWTTFHGLAINLQKDEKAFKGMNPCGFTSEVPISLEEVIDGPVSPKTFKFQIEEKITSFLR